MPGRIGWYKTFNMKPRYQYERDNLRAKIVQEPADTMTTYIAIYLQRPAYKYLVWRYWKNCMMLRVMIKDMEVKVFAGPGEETPELPKGPWMGKDRTGCPVEIWKPEEFNLGNRIRQMWDCYYEAERVRLRADQLFRKQIKDLEIKDIG